MATTSVLYVRRRDAKTIKSQLESQCELDKRFRMVPTTSDAVVDEYITTGIEGDNVQHEHAAEISSGQCIAVPVLQSCMDRLLEYSWASQVVGRGRHYCPFSTAMGNKNCVASVILQDADTALSSSQDITLNDVQHALVKTLISHSLSNADACTTKEDIYSYKTQIVKSVLALSKQTCPKKLEIIGDDRTLVIPRWSFYVINNDDNEAILQNRKGANEFRQLLLQYDHISFIKIQSLLWENLASIHRSLRVVRRGDIDPESGVRESGEHHFFVY
jgi:hypothetical protein